MRILNRNQIKLLAVILMTMNHAARIFLPEGSVLQAVLIDAGYFTAPAMCALLAEGYHYTRDPGRYAGRLLLFALLAQLPYMRALLLENGNVLFTLLLCLLAVHFLNTETESGKRFLYPAGCILLSLFCDWGGVLPMAAILFEKSRHDIRARKGAWAALLFMSGYTEAVSRLSMHAGPGQTVLQTAGALAGPAAAAFCMLALYDEKAPVCRNAFCKWFFYLYYPLHLTVLWLLSVYL